MKKLIALLLVSLLLAACSAPAAQSGTNAQIYEASFLELFDTLTVLKGSAESEESSDSQ